MTDLTIEQRVANGVAWLDEHLPNWPQMIELTELDMADDCRCVIGQTFGDYGQALTDDPHDDDRPHDRTELTYAEAVSLGFDSPSRVSWQRLGPPFRDHPSRTIRSEFEALQAEWTRVITARREAVSNA
jgi:hypothetical protein